MVLLLISRHEYRRPFLPPQFAEAPWSLAKFLDLLQHLWIPVLIVGTGHTAKFIRIIRGNLLDELKKPYVTAARAKGLSEIRLILKYPVRVAINPLVSTIGWTLPELISGIAITAVVLNLPTSGPLLLSALMSQDMQLAGSFIMILSFLTVVGTLLSDILLAWVDPRIRFGTRGSMTQVRQKEDKYLNASTRQLVWWGYKKHLLAMVGLMAILGLYLTAMFCEFLAPYDKDMRHFDFIYSPPSDPDY